MGKEKTEQAVIDYLISENLREGHFVKFRDLAANWRLSDCDVRDCVIIMDDFAESGYFEIVPDGHVRNYRTTKKGVDFINSQP